MVDNLLVRCERSNTFPIVSNLLAEAIAALCRRKEESLHRFLHCDVILGYVLHAGFNSERIETRKNDQCYICTCVIYSQGNEGEKRGGKRKKGNLVRNL